MSKPLGHLAGRCQVRGGARGGGAAQRNRARRRAARWGLENATSTTTRVRAWQGLGELTELGIRRRCGAEGAGDEARAAALGRGRRQVEARGLRTSGRRGSMRGVPARLEGGSGRANGHRQRVILANPEITGVGARARFRGSSGRFFDQVARRASGRRGGAVAVVCKTGDAVAWPDCGGAGRGGAERRGVAARVGGGARLDWERRRGVVGV